MAVKFQLLGTSLTANYAKAWAASAQLNTNGQNASLVSDASSGIFGGSKIDLRNTGLGIKGLVYTGQDNCSLNSAMTVLARIIPTWTGSPSSSQGILEISMGQGFYAGGTLLGINTSGQLQCLNETERGAIILNSNIGPAMTITSGTPMDIWFVWDGSSTAGSLKCYAAQNGNAATLIGTANPGSAQGTRSRQVQAAMILAVSGLYSACDYYLNELVLWDTAENPVSYGARTGFITVPSNNFEGYVSTDPGIANVVSGTNYEINGALLTGTYTCPTSTDPGIANVRSGQNYTINGSNKTGTCAVPAASNVRSGTAVDATTGTCAVPSAANVLSGVSVDATTGTYVTVSISNVRSGITFGAGSALTGTCAVPTAANVLNGVAVDNTTGTYVTVSAANVLFGTTFGPGSSLTGTLQSLDPGINSVLSGVNYKINSVPLTGTYVCPLSVDPGTSNVAAGVHYEISGTLLVGTLATDNPRIRLSLSGRISQSNNLGGRVSDFFKPGTNLGGRISVSNNLGATGGVVL